MTARYASKGFTTPGNELLADTGILYPTLDPTFLLSGSWSYEFPNQWVLSGSGRYALANNESPIPGAIRRREPLVLGGGGELRVEIAGHVKTASSSGKPGRGRCA